MQNGPKPSHPPPYTPDSDPSTVDLFKDLTLDSPWIFPELHRTIQSIKAPICGFPYSVQSSFIPDSEGGRRIQKSNVAKSKAAILSEDMDPVPVPVDDDICMTDTCEATYSDETTEEDAETASVDDVMSDNEDISTLASADRGQRGWIVVPDDENSGTLR